VAVEPGIRSAIDGHVRLLLAWNAAINLTAIRDPAAIAIRHVADSLTAVPVLRERGIEGFIDLGSGGGFPGVPLAAALPAERALLVDSVAKKARFLTTVVEAVRLGGRVAVATERAESVARDGDRRGRWPAVTARAVAALADLVELGLPLLRPGGVLLAWKRGDPGDAAGLGGELAAARRALAAVDDGGRMEVMPETAAAPARGAGPGGPLAGLAGHRLVVIERGRGAVGGAWPRDPAARRRTPW
jgi:16S rRNA (guanine527-N7)-methyltransferase